MAAPAVVAAEPFIDASASRGPAGETAIVGKTNLPSGLKIGVELYVQRRLAGQDFNVMIGNGEFRSGGFTRGTVPYPPGKYRVHFLSSFNEAWQTPKMLRIVGNGGTNLKGKLFKLRDPDVVDSDKQLDYWQTITFAPLSLEAQAITLVKKSVLVVDGQRSAESVQGTIAEFLKGAGLREARGWTAVQTQRDKFTVSYDFIDGQAGEKQAIWSANLATGRVRYVNKSAKIFSWMPNY